MSQEEQAKKTSQVVSDSAVKEVIPTKPAGELSEQELTGVAGGTSDPIPGVDIIVKKQVRK